MRRALAVVPVLLVVVTFASGASAWTIERASRPDGDAGRVDGTPAITRPIAASTPSPARLAAAGDDLELTVLGQFGGWPNTVVVRGTIAYVGVGPRFVTLDVSTPSAPRVLGQTGVLPFTVRDVDVAGDIAIVAGGTDGVRIVDVSDPTRPTEVGALDTPGSALAVRLAGAIAYVADYTAGLRVVDVSQPAHPREIGALDTPDRAQDVDVAGHTAYVADLRSLRTIDVSEPAAPREVGAFAPVEQAAYMVICVEGTTAYVVDNLELVAFDVSDPGAPHALARFGYGPEAVQVVGTFAYVVGQGGLLAVFDVSDPSAPDEVGRFQCVGDPSSVDVAGTTAYVTAGAEEGLQLIDVQRAEAPVGVGAWHVPLPLIVQDVAIAGETVVVAASDRGMRVLDVSEPSAPAEVGAYLDPTFLPWDGGHAIAVGLSGTLAYLVTTSTYPRPRGQHALSVLDVSDPAAPRVLGVTRLSGWAARVHVAEGRAYLSSGGDGRVQIVDVTDPANPRSEGEIAPSPLGYPGFRAVWVSHGIAHVAGGERGLLLFDVSEPAAPREVGSIDTPGTAVDVQVVGDVAYVADREGGLRTVDVSDPARPRELGSLRPEPVTNGVFVSGTVAYVRVTDGSSCGVGCSGLLAVDVSDASAPREAGWVKLPGGSRVVASGDRVYLEGAGAGLLIVGVRPATDEPAARHLLYLPHMELVRGADALPARVTYPHPLPRRGLAGTRRPPYGSGLQVHRPSRGGRHLSAPPLSRPQRSHRAVGCFLGPALRGGAGPGRQLGRPLRQSRLSARSPCRQPCERLRLPGVQAPVRSSASAGQLHACRRSWLKSAAVLPDLPPRRNHRAPPHRGRDGA